nr:phosphate ABC transporter permease subunit PstC [Maliibacterium massiliense]
MKRRRFQEKGAQGVFLLCASISVIAVLLIAAFILLRGLPVIIKVGPWQFITGTEWEPNAEVFGIAPMIVASLISGVLAVLIGACIGVLAAVFLARVAPGRVARAVRPAIDLLAGIPSVIYGFFGMMLIVPLVRNLFGGPGNSMLAAVIILSVMVLPTIVSIAEDALRAVPREYTEGSLALGASPMQTTFKVVLPAARSGIMAGVVLGAGRAIGETMAVLLVAGNRPSMPASLIDPVRTLTANVAMEMSYASGMHQDALFGTGVVLFIFIMLLNFVMRMLSRKQVDAV